MVNVLDNRIPEQLVDQTDFQLEQNYNSVNGKTRLYFGWTHRSVILEPLDYFSGNENVEIDGFAIDEEAVEVEALTHAYGRR